ncbi:MAG: hypothetical protein JKX87_01475 [Cycloclasticus sp.]|nr:hypothetical protein [Cycloclasticus sp.]
MKFIKIRNKVVILLVILGVIQFSGIAIATDGKGDEGHKKGSVGLTHIKSNQLANAQHSILQPRDNLFAITRLDDGAYLLAGNNGLLLKVTGKKGYKKLNLNTNSDLLSVHATQSGKVLLGADKGGLFTSNGALNKWSKTSIDTTESIFNFIELATGEIILSGSYGLLMSSKPPYSTWEPVILPWADYLKEAWQEFGEADPHLYSGCHNQRGDILVVGEFGLVLRRDVAGQWSKIHGGSIEPAIYGCDISGNGEDITLVGQKGFVYESSNSGLSWLKSDIAQGDDLYKVHKTKDLSIIIGDKKNIYISSKPSAWMCRRFIGDRPLGWLVDMVISENETAIIGSNGSFNVTTYASLLDAVYQLDRSKEFVSCE